jgi:2-haloacid dehalogenase
MNKYTNFSLCKQNVLENSCLSLKIYLSQKQKYTLMKEYAVLPAFSNVENGLQSLKEAGHQLYAFSNRSSKARAQLLTNAKITDCFDGIVSLEGV